MNEKFGTDQPERVRALSGMWKKEIAAERHHKPEAGPRNRPETAERKKIMRDLFSYTVDNGDGTYSTFGSDGSVSVTYDNGDGSYSTFGADGGMSVTYDNGGGSYSSYGPDGGMSVTYGNSDGSFSSYGPDGGMSVTFGSGNGFNGED